VADLAGRGRGAGFLLQALALKEAGRAAEGRTLLAEWSTREPANPLAAWAVRAFDGAASAPPDTAGEEARVLAAWLRGPARTASPPSR